MNFDQFMTLIREIPVAPMLNRNIDPDQRKYLVKNKKTHLLELGTSSSKISFTEIIAISWHLKSKTESKTFKKLRPYLMQWNYFHKQKLQQYGKLALFVRIMESFRNFFLGLGFHSNSTLIERLFPFSVPTTVPALVKKAKDSFGKKNITYQERKSESPLIDQFSKNSFSSLFTQSDTVCLGETHEQNSSKKFLINNMQNLKNYGVTTIFAEIFRYEDQHLLDAYLTGNDAKIGPDLRRCLDNMYSASDYCDVLIKAREVGIRIVGSDSQPARDTLKTGISVENVLNRGFALNYNMYKIWKREKGLGKSINWSGSAHMTKFTLYKTDQSIEEVLPGIADLTQTPAVFIGKDYIKKQFSGESSNPDFLIED